MTTIFGGLRPLGQSMDFHLQRQNLIAGNLANVDTPGFAPREIHRTIESENAGFSLTLKATNDAHLYPGGGDESADYKIEEERNEVPGNDLNFVSMDHEMAKLGANSLRFKVLGKLVSHHLGILRYAVQGR